MVIKFCLKILTIVANNKPIDKIAPFKAYGEKVSDIKLCGIRGLVRFSLME